jgi:hypothetical protein
MRWASTLSAALVVGCAALAPRSAFDQKLDDGRFAFAYAEGAEWYGYDVLHVADDGSCRYTFSELPTGSDDPVWKQHEFSIDKDTLAALKNELNDSGFMHLPASDDEQGQRAFMWLRFGLKPKVVRVKEDRPLEFTRVSEYVTKKILDPRRPELAKGKLVDKETGTAAAKAGLSAR